MRELIKFIENIIHIKVNVEEGGKNAENDIYLVYISIENDTCCDHKKRKNH